MLYAIEWIRAQLMAANDAAYRFLDGLTFESIGVALTRSPMLVALCVLIAVVLLLVGFRSHKMLSSFLGGAALGTWGWAIGVSINPNLMASAVLFTLIFAVIGMFFFYFLYVINLGVGSFLCCFVLLRELIGLSIIEGVIAGIAFAVIYCLLLARRPVIRTPIEAGALLALITLHFFGYIGALCTFAIVIAGGIVLQHFLNRRHEAKKQIARDYKPNAPSPPTPEEIAAEIAEEEALKKSRAVLAEGAPAVQ